jgi:P-type E1-E2 ATPase
MGTGGRRITTSVYSTLEASTRTRTSPGRAVGMGVIKALHRMGIRTILLTGDSRRVADAVGSRLGIEDIEAELLPEDKLRRVAQRSVP